jgi:hypothetical protein
LNLSDTGTVWRETQDGSVEDQKREAAGVRRLELKHAEETADVILQDSPVSLQDSNKEPDGTSEASMDDTETTAASRNLIPQTCKHGFTL